MDDFDDFESMGLGNSSALPAAAKTSSPPLAAKPSTTYAPKNANAASTNKVTDTQAKRIADRLVHDPAKHKKIAIIVVSVVAAAIVIGVIVAVVVLVTRPAPAPTPTPTPSQDPAFPNIPKVTSSKNTPIPHDILSDSLSQVTFYPQTGSNVGALLSADGSASQLVTMDVATNATGNVFVDSESKPNKFLSAYLSPGGQAGGTFISADDKVHLFDVDVASTAVANFRSTSVPTDASSFSPTLYWVTTATQVTGTDPASAVTSSLVVSTTDPQTFVVESWLQDGTNVPQLAAPGQLPSSEEYRQILFASNQPAFAALFVTQEAVLSLHVDGTSTSFSEIETSPSSGALVSGAANEAADVLVVARTTSVHCFKRSNAATFTQTDYFFLPFSGSILFAAVSLDGSWFMVSTDQSILVFGKIVDGVFQRQELFQLHLADESTTLVNTNGPCGLGLSSDQQTLFLFQSDNLRHAEIFQIPIRTN
jgi:hypothetical protein